MVTPKRLRERLQYDPLSGLFCWGASGKLAGSARGNGYWRVSIDGVAYHAHRLAWLYVYDEWPSGLIDHINRKRSDNRISNLRDVGPGLNSFNQDKRCDNTSGEPGVTWRKSRNRWIAQIWKDRRLFRLGSFKDKGQAVRARKRAVAEMYGCL
jgi:hypothetical protein